MPEMRQHAAGTANTALVLLAAARSAGSLAALLFVFAVERIGLRFAWRLMHTVLGITNVLSWFGWG
ncbi:hypothetical protein [Streptomyces sp. NPDC057072]|uniref:hypothetical protein n=1 Tax=Streptomyces sp. NPDC057072 TaxID=3346014 RepID=UPI00363CEBD9